MKKFLLICFAIAYLLVADSTSAGFGITPPYVRNASLTRNSRYKQEILMVRSDPVEDLQGEITISVPGANDWITIDKGTEFILPKGEKKILINVNVNVPNDAEFGNYLGNIRIRVAPLTIPEPGTVGIALGAQVDVDLTVIDKEIINFRIQRIRVSDLDEGHKVLWMDFPGKIRFTMQIENTGNVPSAPRKIEFDLYDTKGEELLEFTRNSNKLKKVDPFDIQDVVAQLPTHLKAGSYKVIYRIYKEELIAQEGNLNLSILPYGTIQDGGYGIMGLSTQDKAILLSILIGILAALWIVIRLIRRRR